MITRWTKRAGVAFAALLVVTAGVWCWSAAPTQAEASDGKEAKETRLKKLLKERLAVLKEVAAEAEKGHAGGAVPLERVIQAAEAVLKAELDLCESTKDRISLLEKVVATAKQREDAVEKLANSGTVPVSNLRKAKISRLEAEIALERAKQK